MWPTQNFDYRRAHIGGGYAKGTQGVVPSQAKEKSLGTNKAENFFSQLKRSLDGTHHAVSGKHLGRYVSEFDFRYSTHQMTDEDRMVLLMSQVPGRRLSYRPLTSG